ncbi:hypothetical protein, partial [Aeromicrobium sp. CF3.5]|uniref:hypothetical protein n=1 Tax=Aeromicrobium sp. CF3.5 TaxID=3373078 RepID=UPI003EE59BD9
MSAAAVGFTGSSPSDRSGPAIPSDPPAPSTKATNGAPRLTLGDEEVSVEVPQRSYVSYSDRRTTQYREPEPISAGQLTLSTSDDIGGEVTIFVTRPDKRIKDVLVFGNYVTARQVVHMQWLMSKDGIELAWKALAFSDWTVERGDVVLTSEGAGRFFDAVSLDEPTPYQISHVKKVEVQTDGRTVIADKGTSYLGYLPPYDDSLIGKHIDSVEIGQSAPGLVPRSPWTAPTPSEDAP